MNYIRKTWEDFETDVRILAWKIRQSRFRISNIYGVPRGGMIVAIRLSHLLNKPLIANWADRTPQTLIVDDVIDTGATLASPACAGCWKIVALYYNPKASITPNIFVAEKTSGEWIDFPWESK